jgi:hypothetical protein
MHSFGFVMISTISKRPGMIRTQIIFIFQYIPPLQHPGNPTTPRLKEAIPYTASSPPGKTKASNP